MSDEKKLLNRLIEIGIQNPIQLEENDIFYWWQKKFREIQNNNLQNQNELLININQNMSDNKINKKIGYVLDQVGLNGFEKRPIHTLSGGQKQRLTIACALISNRNFIILDEPTALLDQTSQLKVLKTIKNLTSDHKKPLSALWITHRYEELTYADAVAELKNGFLSSWQEPSKFQYN